MTLNADKTVNTAADTWRTNEIRTVDGTGDPWEYSVIAVRPTLDGDNIHVLISNWGNTKTFYFKYDLTPSSVKGLNFNGLVIVDGS